MPQINSAGQKFWQGNDQGKGFFTRAFALACPGVVPPHCMPYVVRDSGFKFT